MFDTRPLLRHSARHQPHPRRGAVSMPKNLFVDPVAMRRPAELAFPRIPVHAYAGRSPRSAARGDATLTRVLRHMMIVREFESMLAAFKSTGATRASIRLQGSAHLSIGQGGRGGRRGAGAVARGPHLRQPPQPRRVHRQGPVGHRETRPGRSAGHHGASRGRGALSSVERAVGGAGETDLAENFLLFGLLAEIFMRANGFNGGMGGSMHAFFPPIAPIPTTPSSAPPPASPPRSARPEASHPGGITVANAGEGPPAAAPSGRR